MSSFVRTILAVAAIAAGALTVPDAHAGQGDVPLLWTQTGRLFDAAEDGGAILFFVMYRWARRFMEDTPKPPGVGADRLVGLTGIVMTTISPDDSDRKGRVQIEGELVQFLFRNPHSFVHVMVKEKDGSMVRYTVERGGAGQLGGQGVTRETLKVGDRVIITGSPGRNATDHRVRMVTLHRPKDGFGWGKRPGEVVD